ncbi:MAG TPA: sulfate ABC transporter permease subunit CysT [Thermoanaerobaculia bacterium]|jgi:sulfate transport system permease protein|nr:sulfate ABC transporter permease subunit CysT [Thermoanaerobaculia bacterium]
MVETADKRVLPSPLPVSTRKARKGGRFPGGSPLPGFGLSLGFTLLYLCLVILIPVSTVFLKTATLTWAEFLSKVTTPRALAAFELSFQSALIAALLNCVFGVLVAWVLERYPFPGRRLIDSMVDLPFALPTAVAGIALVTIYTGNGWVGRFLEPMGIKVAYTPLGIIVALTFIGLPFVVRTVQPVLADLDREVEEAAASLGAGRLQTFRRVILPELVPAIATGFVLAFARGLGEYGSVIFIAGNMPKVSEITPLLIMIQLEQYDTAGATAIAMVFLLASFSLLFLINILAWRRSRRLSGNAEER